MKSAMDLVAEAKQKISEISVDEAEAAIAQADLLIDVREPDEFQAGHLRGAVSMPRGLLEFKLSNDPAFQSRDLDIVLYCKTSGRAALSAESLSKMGYLKVKSITGGFDAWAQAGKEVITPNQPDFG